MTCLVNLFRDRLLPDLSRRWSFGGVGRLRVGFRFTVRVQRPPDQDACDRAEASTCEARKHVRYRVAPKCNYQDTSEAHRCEQTSDDQCECALASSCEAPTPTPESPEL